MSSQAAKLKKLMKTTIRDMARNPAQFTRTPGRDFTRKRKLDFASVVSILLSMSGGSTASSLMDYFKFDPNTASTSAFVQQRAKLKPKAMEYLFQRFVQGSPAKKTFRGYRLLAVDGSDLQILADPNDLESYYPGVDGQRSYSLLHLNALYDLENRVYTDAFIQKSRGWNEHKALIEMLDRMTNAMGRQKVKLSIKEYDAMQSGWRKWVNRELEIKGFRDWGMSFTGKDILEVGCGSGYSASLIVKDNPRSYTGIDIMPEQLEKAEALGLQNARFVQGDAADLSRFEDQSFDMIVDFMIDLIITKSVSRFCRNTGTLLKAVRELKDLGVGVFFELQNLNTLTESGELMLTILAAFAQAESENYRKLAQMACQRKFEAGIPLQHLEKCFGYDQFQEEQRIRQHVSEHRALRRKL